MLTLVSLKRPAQIIGSAIIFVAIGSLFPAVAGDASTISIDAVQPLETPTGKIEDLQGLESRTAAEWFWGVGGEYEANVSTTLSDFKPASEEVQREQQNWSNLNRGDIKPTDTVPSYPHVKW